MYGVDEEMYNISGASTSVSNSEIMVSEDKDDLNLVDNNSNEENVCKIEILNDDCLTHIFTFLPRKQLIRIERVCKRWQDVALSCWSIVKKVSTIDIVQGPYASVSEMACYLQHTVKYCTALQCLEIKYVYPLEKLEFSGNLMQLEELTLDGCSLTDAGLRNVFKICPNITTLTISLNSKAITGESLQFLNLQKLTFDVGQCSSECLDSLIASLKRMENLKSLSLEVHICQEMTSKQFQQIFKNSPNVEHLTVTNCKPDTITTIGTSSFGIPKNLVSLDLHDNSLVNDAIIILHMHIISVCWCNVTDVGIGMLVNLPHLKYLSLGQIRESYYIDDYVTDRELELLASRRKLVKLEIRYNSKITDKGCAKILSLCKELEHLNLRGCRNITSETVMLADTAVISRTNNKKLELVLEGTDVFPFKDHWKDLTPSLILDFKFDRRQY